MRKCPICNEINAELLFNLDFAFESGHPLSKKNEIVCCGKCGFVYARNELEQANYDDYYTRFNMYSDSVNVKHADNQFEVYEFMTGILSKYIKSDDSVIDVGCGDGKLLHTLHNHGINNLTGLDPSEISSNLVKEDGIISFCGSIFGISNMDIPSFDIVISSFVTEHIFDLDGYISNLISLTKQDGAIAIFVPAVEGFEKHFSSLPNYFNHEHINYFSKISLDNLLLAHGFVEVSQEERVIVQPDGEYCLFGLYKRGNTDRNLVFDDISKKIVKDYLEKYNNSKTNIDALLNSDEEYILWGTGSLALQLLAYEKIKDKIRYCIDNNTVKQGTLFASKKVYPAEHILQTNDKYKIIICSMMNSDAIIKQIKSLNITNEYIVFS